MGDIAQWFKAYEVSPRPLVAIARDKIIDLVGRSWTLTFGIESNCVVVNSDGGFLGIARIEVDDHQDDIAGGGICLGLSHDIGVIDRHVFVELIAGVHTPQRREGRR